MLLLQVKTNLRPYVASFLKSMHQLFDIVLFTAAEESYANLMRQYLDPDNSIVKLLLHRDHCTKVKGKVNS